jgi:hypothetical protein
LRFFFPWEPVKAFNGNSVLESSTGRGVLEHLALVPVVSGADAFHVCLDNFQVIHVTQP